MIAAITGHRPDKLGGYKTPNAKYNLVMDGLNQAFTTLAPTFVITGMALGVDQWAAELCIQRGIPFIAAIPCDGHEKIWPPHSQEKYQQILQKAHTAYIIKPGPYASWKMHARNEWMVQSCDTLIAVCDGSDGGTSSCLAYAHSIQKNIYRVPLPATIAKGPATIDFNVLIDKKNEIQLNFLAAVKAKMEEQKASTTKESECFLKHKKKKKKLEKKAEQQVSQIPAEDLLWQAQAMAMSNKLNPMSGILMSVVDLVKKGDLKIGDTKAEKEIESGLTYGRIMDLD